jgi:hypothetical protein
MAIRNDDPPDYEDGVTKLQDQVWDLCERAGFPGAACNRIMEAIAKEESAIQAGEYKDQIEAEMAEQAYWESVDREAKERFGEK